MRYILKKNNFLKFFKLYLKASTFKAWGPAVRRKYNEDGLSDSESKYLHKIKINLIFNYNSLLVEMKIQKKCLNGVITVEDKLVLNWHHVLDAKKYFFVQIIANKEQGLKFINQNVFFKLLVNHL